MSLREALGTAGALPPRRGQQGLGERVWEAVFRAAVMSAERKAGVRNVVQWPLCPPPLPSCSPAHTQEPHSGFMSRDTPQSCTVGHSHHRSPDMRCHLMCPRTCRCAFMHTHAHAHTRSCTHGWICTCVLRGVVTPLPKTAMLRIVATSHR